MKKMSNFDERKMAKTLQKSTLFLDLRQKICYPINVQKRNTRKKESGNMLNDEICELREKLNKSIIAGEDYKITYGLSVKLDELIAKYYRKGMYNKMNKQNTNEGIRV